jgi:hypothetical protein
MAKTESRLKMSGENNESKWPYIVEQELLDQNNIYFRLYHVAKQLNIGRSFFHGNILAFSKDDVFPERFLIGRPESHFQTIKNDVVKLLTIEQLPYFYPRFTENIILPPVEEIINLKQGEIGNYPTKPKYILSLCQFLFYKLPNFFDFSFELESYEIGNQIEHGLLDSLYQTLKPGGIFVGSGEMNIQTLPKYTKKYTTIKAMSLTDALGFPFYNHGGFILQKTQ